MSAPNPLTGTFNPFTGMYQSRQFGVGTLAQVPFYVTNFLASPPANLVTSATQTPLVEEAAFFGLYNQVITVTGSPTSGTFTLQYGVNFTSAQQYNASAATIQTALRGLTSIGSPNVTVTGSNGGPWTVVFAGAFSNQAVQLIQVRNQYFVGGTLPTVVVTASGEQQGFVPF